MINLKNYPRIITISGAAGAGKDTLAQLISNHVQQTVHIMSFADEIKFILAKYLDWDGRKDDYGRKLLQNVGTRGREMSPYFWANRTLENIELCVNNSNELVILPDCRYQEEIDIFRQDGYRILSIVITGRGSELSPAAAAHSSEQYWKEGHFDLRIVNDGSIDDLAKSISPILNWITSE